VEDLIIKEAMVPAMENGNFSKPGEKDQIPTRGGIFEFIIRLL
jgi:hypothetical protein